MVEKAVLWLVCLVPVAALAAGRGGGAQVAFRWVPKGADAPSAIGSIGVDGRDPDCVTGDWKGGAEDVGGERDCWRKGRLVKTGAYSVRPLYDRETGEFSCYEHVDTTYAGGRKRVRRNCTKRFRGRPLRG